MSTPVSSDWDSHPFCALRTRLPVRAAGAIVFLKVLLRKAVERERRNGAFETWSGKAPHAL